MRLWLSFLVCALLVLVDSNRMNVVALGILKDLVKFLLDFHKAVIVLFELFVLREINLMFLLFLISKGLDRRLVNLNLQALLSKQGLEFEIIRDVASVHLNLPKFKLAIINLSARRVRRPIEVDIALLPTSICSAHKRKLITRENLIATFLLRYIRILLQFLLHVDVQLQFLQIHESSLNLQVLILAHRDQTISRV